MDISKIKFTVRVINKRPKRNSPKKEGINRVLTKRVRGVITNDSNDNVFCRIKCHDKDGNSIDDALPFTKDSYDVKGREIIFKRGRDEKGRRICIIRGIDKAKAAPNDTLNYTSLREKWICDGYVVLVDNIKQFKLHKIIKPYNSILDNISND